MGNRIKYKLKGNASKSDINEEGYTKVSFTGERRLLPVGEINKVVDVGAEFNRERNASFIYRFQGTISPLFSNVLMNPTSNYQITSYPLKKTGNGLDVFDNDLFKKDQTTSSPGVQFVNEIGGLDLDYSESINKYLIEKDGWFGFTDPDIRNPNKTSYCEFYDMEPSRNRFDLNSNINNNWELTVTYPFDSDDTHYVVDGGLLIIVIESVIVGGKPMIALGTSTQHGLENGDRVRLTNMPNSLYNKDFTVKRLGLDDGTLQQNYFAIDIESIPATLPTGTIGGARMKKVINGEESKYYLRKFKKILAKDDYEIYPLAFSRNIFSDSNYQCIINEDIDVEGLTDNLGRPISELYLTILKTDSNGMFGPVKSGLDLELLPGNLNSENISNIRRIHDGPTLTTPSTTAFNSHEPLPGETDLKMSNANWFYGDVVEYNKYTCKETVLADVLHRFNTNNRESGNETKFFDNNTPPNLIAKSGGPRREGYMYKPHHLYKIREFSLYIEQGDSSTDGIPEYAEDLGDGRFLWRDFLDIGIYDGEGEPLDYPFTNGAHYLHQNICFITKRQDPFGNYNLYYAGDTSPFDPADPIGDGYTDKFIVKSSQDVC